MIWVAMLQAVEKWAFDKGTGYNRTVVEHILKVNKVAVMHVLCIIIGIVEMYNTFVMGFYYVLGQEYSCGNIS